MSQDNRPGISGPPLEIVPDGDTRPRSVCADCGYIEYNNPKVVVGAVCTWEDRVLLCRRAIQPRLGFWTVPAGFMELGETMAAGAARETYEEALAHLHMGPLLGVYEIPHISQIHVFYRARLRAPDFGPGPESAEVALFDWDDIPWDDMAFPSIIWALKKFRDEPEEAAPHLDSHQG
jgi:ADP-ribose pyrophosphatase YjhB (NUDIX family)